MNRILEVCLAGLILVLGSMVADTAAAQTLQQGIAVVMAKTQNASPMPEADNADAWIVAVTEHGDLFFGLESVTPEGLLEAMKSRPRNRDQKLYIKADARAPWADVQRVLASGRAVSFEAPVLLTSQPESPAPGTIVPPKGLEVLVIPPPGGAPPIAVQVNSGEPAPALKVNNEAIAPDALESRLKQLLENSREKVVLVKADGLVPFAEVVRVIDACRAAGAKAVLATPEL
jgi:biopolymer transport protein ExbD